MRAGGRVSAQRAAGQPSEQQRLQMPSDGGECPRHAAPGGKAPGAGRGRRGRRRRARRGDGSPATCALRSDPTRVPLSSLDSRVRCATGAWRAGPTCGGGSSGAATRGRTWSVPSRRAATRSGATPRGLARCRSDGRAPCAVRTRTAAKREAWGPREPSRHVTRRCGSWAARVTSGIAAVPAGGRGIVRARPVAPRRAGTAMGVPGGQATSVPGTRIW
jgi:hypothetical protein